MKNGFSYLFVLLFLLTGCFSENEEGDSASVSPGSGISSPVLSSMTSNSFFSQELIDFLLLSEDQDNCLLHKVILKTGTGEQIFNSIQEAINSAPNNSEISVGKGVFNEKLIIKGKTYLKLISQCKPMIRGAIDISKSKNVLVQGFRVNPGGLAKNGISLRGDSYSNDNVTLKLNEIFNANNKYQGILVEKKNANILINQNYIHHNGRNGIRFRGKSETVQKVEGNVIVENRWNGVKTGKNHKIELRRNLIVANGRDSSPTGGNYGVLRKGDTNNTSTNNLTLVGNTIAFNFGKVRNNSSQDLGKFDQILDNFDVDNYTTQGSEGESVSQIDDRLAPEIRVSFNDNINVDRAIFTFSGVVTDQSTVKVRIFHNGQEIFFSDQLVFQSSLVLNEGVNTIEIQATDAFDNTAIPINKTVIFTPASGTTVPVVRCNPGEIYVLDQASNEQTFANIQDAVDTASEFSTIFIGSGVFNEVVDFKKKENVTLKTLCQAQIQGVSLSKSEFITIDGFVIDASDISKKSVFLKGGGNSNKNVTIANNEIRNTSNAHPCIEVEKKNTETRIINNYIHHCGQNGIDFSDSMGGPQFVEKNIIRENGYNGVHIGKQHIVTLINNVITGNGTRPGNGGGRYGIFRRNSNQDYNAQVTLLNNTIVNNNGAPKAGRDSIDIGNYDQILDSSDSGNFTSNGDEGLGVDILNDTAKPQIVLAQSDGIVTNNPTLALSIAVSDQSLVTTQVFLNGDEVYKTMFLNSTPVLTLLTGNNQIEVRSTDQEGNSNSVFLNSVILDVLSPVLIADANTELTNNPSYSFVVDVTDDASTMTTIILNGQEQIVSAAKTFPVSLTLVEGDNTIEITSVDEWGLQAVPVTFTVPLDITAPQLLSFSPEDGSDVISDTGVVAINGLSNEELQSVTVNGQAMTLSAGKTDFSGSLTLPLVSGSQTFNYLLTDLAGNTSEVSSTFNFITDTLAPVITSNLVSPLLTNNPLLSFQVTISDTSATVTNVSLNGEIVVADSTEKLIPVSLTLIEGDNTIEISSVDEWGLQAAPLILEVHLDSTPPQLLSFSPNDGSEIISGDGVVTINGQANEKLQSVTVNGQAMTLAAGEIEFSTSITFPLATGAQTLNFVLTDLAGNVTSTSSMFNFVADVLAPVVSSNLVSPLLVKDPSLLFEVTISDISSTVTNVSLNGEVVVADSTEKLISVSLTLNEGDNTIEITSVDEWGLSAADLTVEVGLDSIAPQLLSFSPINGSEVISGDGVVAISGQSNEKLQSVTVNGQVMSLDAGETDFSGSLALPLVSGPQTLTYLLIDLAGNATTVTSNFDFTVDAAVPVIATGVVSPVLTNDQDFSFQIDITDISSTVTNVSLNGEVVVADSAEKSIPISLALVEGDNSIEITSVDEWGLQAISLNLEIHLDSTPPQLLSFSPVDGSEVISGDGNISLSGQSNEKLQSVTVNGEPMTLATGETGFSGILTLPLVSGLQTLTYFLTDLAGNTTTVTSNFDFTVDTTAPVITTDVTSPVLTSDQDFSFQVDVADISSTTTEVKLNGQVVVTDSAEKSIPVSLALVEGGNTIEISSVDEWGLPAISVILEVRLDSVTPQLLSFSPAEGVEIISGTGNISVSGQSNEKLQSVTVNGQAMTLAAGETGFSGSLTLPLTSGPQTFIYLLTDLAGNTATVVSNFNFTADTAVPVITTDTTPLELTNNPSFTFSLTVDDVSSTSTTVKFNGQAVVEDSVEQLIPVNLTLSEGDNTIEITSSDEWGLQATPIVLETHLDSTAPQFLSLTPASGSEIVSGDGVVVISGQADEKLQTLTLNGEALTIAADDVSFSKTVTYPLISGVQILEFVLTDNLGNSRNVTSTFTFTADVLGPVITSNIDSPVVTNNPVFPLQLQIEDLSSTSTSVKVNDQEISTEDSSKNISLSISLTEGVNSIQVDSVDEWGLVATALVLQVELDTDLPILVVNTQSAPLTSDPNFLFDISVSDELSVVTSIINNGSEVFSTSDSVFSHTVTLVEGANNLIVRATDAAGNVTQSDAIVVILDTIAPQITQSSPSNGEVVIDENANVVISLQIDESVSEVLIDGVPPDFAIGDTLFSTTFATPQVGLNSFTVELVDLIGNTSSETIEFELIVDPNPPEITLGLNDGYLTNQTSLDLPITITDVAPTITEVFHNGFKVGEFTDKNIVVNLSLTDGVNRIEVKSIDDANNIAIPKSLDNIVLDRTPPVVFIGAPIEGEVVEFVESPITFSMIGGSNEKLSIAEINGEPIELSSDQLQFSSVIQPNPEEGLFQFTVVVKDLAGNEASITRSVFVDQLERTEYIYVISQDTAELLRFNLQTLELESQLIFTAENFAPGIERGLPTNLIATADSENLFVAIPASLTMTFLDAHGDALLSQTKMSFETYYEGGDRNIAIPKVNPIATTKSDTFTVFTSTYDSGTSADPELPEGEDPDFPAAPGFIGIVNNAEYSDITKVGLPLPNSPESVVFSPNEAFVYFTSLSNTIGILDMASRQITNYLTVALPNLESNGIAVTPDGAKLLITNRGGNSVAVIDSQTGAIIQNILLTNGESKTTQIQVDEVGRFAYVVSTSDTDAAVLSKIDLFTNGVVVDSSFTSSIGDIVLSPNQEQIWVSLTDEDRVSIRAVGDLSEMTSLAVARPTGVAFGFLDEISQANRPPLALFGVTEELGVAPFDAQFSAEFSKDVDGTIASYSWNFGDQTSGQGVNVNHRFSSPGTYNVTLTVTDNQGATNSVTKQVEAVDQNELPTANFTVERKVDFGILRVDFDASSSFKRGGEIASYTWDFGDGGTGGFRTISHFFDATGTFDVTLTVEDRFGNSHSITKSVSAQDITPGELIITSPPFNGLVNTRNVPIEGSSNEGISELSINGLPSSINVDGESFAQSVGYSSDGLKSVKIETKDLEGNRTVLNIPFTIDTRPTLLTITQPAAGSTLYSNTGEVAVTIVSDEPLSELSAAQQSIPVSESGLTHSGTVVFQNSQTVNLVAEAKDLAGNLSTTEKTFTIVVDDIVPVISSSEMGPVMTSNSTLDFNVSIDDESPVTTVVKLNENVILTTSDVNFDVNSSLTEGVNVFKIQSTDAAGNSSELVIDNIVLDTIAPVINIATKGERFVNDTQFLFEASVFDANDVLSEISINGAGVQSTPEKNISTTLTLGQGDNSIEITAVDAAGNASIVQTISNIAFDEQAPVLTGFLPGPNSVLETNDAAVLFQMQSDEPLSLATINGFPISTADGLTYFGMVVLNSSQVVNDIQAIGIDLAGNQTVFEYSVDLNHDDIVPVITVAETGNFTTQDPVFQLSIGVQSSNDIDVYVYHDDVPIFFGSTSVIDLPVTLNEGENNFRVEARDNLGNTATPVEISAIILDTLVPQIISLNPSEGTIVEGLSVDFSGTTNESVDSLTVNGQEAILSPDGQTFNIQLDFAAPGPRILEFLVIDAAGNSSSRSLPIDVVVDDESGGGGPFVAIGVGAAFSCAAVSGSAYCWGGNASGQLGDGTTTARLLPVPVTGLQEGVREVITTYASSCAIMEDDTMKCWGRNSYGQLGNGMVQAESPLPTNVLFPSPQKIVKVAGGEFHTCAMVEAANQNGVMCWGDNSYGAIGAGESVIGLVTPTFVAGLEEGVVALDAGLEHTCVAMATGEVKCFGFNENGRLGDGTEITRKTPVDVFGIDNAIDVATGVGFSCALLADKSMKCWGDNSTGNLGTGTQLDSLVPIEVACVDNVRKMALGQGTACAILDNGEVRCWGDNQVGGVGVGSTTNRIYPAPTAVLGIGAGSEVLDLRLKTFHVCATFPAEMRCWGSNSLGQLGTGDTTYRSVPTVVQGLPSFDGTNSISVKFAMSPTSGTAPQEVLMNASASMTSVGTITSYNWDFGDGSSATGVTTQHTYNQAGTYLVTLTIGNSLSEVNSRSSYIVVKDPQMPTALFTITPQTDLGDLRVNLVSHSSSSDGEIASHSWDFGDGTSGSGVNTSHVYTNPGDYLIKLTVTSDRGLQAMLEKQIHVRDLVGPVLNIASPTDDQLQNNKDIVFTGTSNEKLSSLTFNGSNVPLDTSLTAFNKTFQSVQDGIRTARVEAIDLVGNKTVVDLGIKVDTTAPVLSNISPFNGETIFTNVASIQVTANADEELGQVTVNGTNASLDSGNTSFSANVPLPMAVQDFPLTISAFDKAGNQTDVTVVIDLKFDNIAPVVNLHEAKNNIFTQESEYVFGVSVTDDHNVTTRVLQNGLEIQSTSETNFAVEATLSEGLNTFVIESTDQATNVTTVQINGVVLDTEAPVINIAQPSSGQVLTNSIFNVSGSVNEQLESLIVGGQNLPVASNSFSSSISVPASGDFDLEVKATDLAGNITTVNVPLTFNVVLVKSLVSFKQSAAGRYRFFGARGATTPGASVSVSAGLFNSASGTSNFDGSFELFVDRFESATLTATNTQTGQSDSMSFTHVIETTLAGVIQDTNGNGLPGVVVTISGSSQTATTDYSGAFEFQNPITGTHRLLIDPTSLSTSEKEYTTTSAEVNIRFDKRNILENPIFLCPLMKDETSVFLAENTSTLIRNDRDAPGVALSVPSGVKATFPGGAKSGLINIAKAPGSSSTIPTLDFATPTEIIYFEPTGLEFDKPVKVTFPNSNELPPGTEFILVSMNAKTGAWELSGTAAVSPDGRSVVSKEGQGITHFSPAYPIPIPPIIREYAKPGQNGIDIFKGSLSNQIELPSFKSLGRTVTPTLTYKSAWAKPTAVVTNFLDIKDQRVDVEVTSGSIGGSHVYCDSQEGSTNCFDSYFDMAAFAATAAFPSQIEAVKQAAWYQPESISADFSINNIQTGIDVTDESNLSGINYETMTWAGGIANQTLLSFATELKNPDINGNGDRDDYFATGLYPTNAHFEIKLKNIILSTRKSLKNNYLLDLTYTQSSSSEEHILNKIFPSDLNSTVYVQNEVNSSYGRGWRVGGIQKVINPEASSLVIDEGNGEISIYNANDKIETIYSSSNSAVDLTQGVSFAWPRALVVQTTEPPNSGGERIFEKVTRSKKGLDRNFATLHFSSGNVSLNSSSGIIPTEQGEILYATGLCPYGPVNGTIRSNPHHRFNENRLSYRLTADIGGVLLTEGGNFYATDLDQHALFRQGSSGPFKLAGRLQEVAEEHIYNMSDASLARNYCHKYLGGCTLGETFVRDYWCDNNVKISASWKGIKVSFDYKFDPATAEYFETGFNVNAGNYYPISSDASNGYNRPQGMAEAPDGRIFIADTNNNKIKYYNPQNGSTGVIAGNTNYADTGDGGQAVNASIAGPLGLTFDRDGNLYISTKSGRIRKIDPNGFITTIAGQGSRFDDEGPASEMNFQRPMGMVVDENKRTLYIADYERGRVYALGLDNSFVSTLVGDCNGNGLGDGGPARSGCLNGPNWLGLDDAGNLLISDSGNEAIRRVTFDQTGGGEFIPSKLDGSRIIKLGSGFERTFLNGTKVIYDVNGLQKQTIEKNGRVTNFEYDGLGRVTKITDPVSQTITYGYTGDFLQSITTPAGTTTFNIGSDGTLDRVTFPDGTSKSYGYRDDGLMDEEFDQRQVRTGYEYSENNRIAKVIRAGLPDFIINDPIEETIGNGFVGGSAGEMQSNLIEEVEDPNGNIVKVLRDINGLVAEIQDAEGLVTKIFRNERGQTTKIIRPNGTEKVMEYQDKEPFQLKSARDTETGKQVSYEYDQYGNVLEETMGTGLITSRVFDSQTGLLKQETDPRGVIRTINYHQFDLVRSVSKPVGNGTTFVSTNEYNSLGQLTRKYDTTGADIFYTYNATGEIETKRSVRDGTTILQESFEYDVFGRPVLVTSNKGEETEYVYLPTGQLEKVFDDSSNEVLFTYNDLGRLIEKKDASGFITTFTYDNNGNVVQEVDPKGNLKTFEYDSKDRLVRKILPDDIVEFEYDYNDQITFARNNVSEIIVQRDVLGRIVSSSLRGLGELGGFNEVVLTSDYDNNDNRIFVDDGSERINYYYNNSTGELDSIVNHKGEVFTFAFDNLGRLKTMGRPGVSTQIDYNNLLGAKRIDHVLSGAGTDFFDYSRDDMGQVTGVTTNEGSQSFTYDQNNYLASATQPAERMPADSSSSFSVETFNYDNLGNRIQDRFGAATFDSRKQRIVSDGRFSYIFDDNGNLQSKTQLYGDDAGKIVSYSYSSENQLVKVQFLDSLTGPKTKEIDYFYDALGRRIQKVAQDFNAPSDPAKSFTRRYVYDRNEIHMEMDGSNEILARYTHSTLRTDDVLAVDITDAGKDQKLATSVGTFHYLKDALGSVRSVTDSSGSVVQRYVYSAYGELLNIQNGIGVDITSNPVLATSFSFTGREYDFETEMYYYRARYYDPGAGRFLQTDPDPGKTSMPITIVNAYAYVLNSPLNFRDPSGKSLYSDLTSATGAIGGVLTITAILYTSVITGGTAGVLVGNFISGIVNGGFIGGAVGGVAAVAAGAFVGRLAGAIAGGLTGGVFGVIHGGGLGAGFQIGGRLGLNLGAVVGGAAGGLFFGLGEGRDLPSGSIFDKFGKAFIQPILDNPFEEGLSRLAALIGGNLAGR